MTAGETARGCTSKRWLKLKIKFKRPLSFHLLHLDSQCKGKVFDTEFFQINRRSFSRQEFQTWLFKSTKLNRNLFMYIYSLSNIPGFSSTSPGWLKEGATKEISIERDTFTVCHKCSCSMPGYSFFPQTY